MNPYLKFWDLDRPLFTRLESPPALYIPPRLVAPLERLVLACEQETALAVMTGEPGTGKTALARWLCEALPTAVYDVLLLTLVRREHVPGWLMPRLAEHLGVRISGDRDSPIESLGAVAARLEEYLEQNRKLTVIIDAAHMLTGDNVFDELVAFLGLQAVAGGCIAFVLVGGESLSRQIATVPELAPRVAYELRVPCLSPTEAAAYLEHRIQAAGARVSFEPDALDALYAATRGVIAALNAQAEGCLVEAYQRGARTISLPIVLGAATSSLSHSQPPLPPLPSPPGRTISQVESSRPPGQSQETGEQPRSSGAAISLNSLFKRGGV